MKPNDLFRVEAERLAKLSARERKEALAVHWRIADDAKLSQVTRDYARHVAETLEASSRTSERPEDKSFTFVLTSDYTNVILPL